MVAFRAGITIRIEFKVSLRFMVRLKLRLARLTCTCIYTRKGACVSTHCTRGLIRLMAYAATFTVSVVITCNNVQINTYTCTYTYIHYVTDRSAIYINQGCVELLISYLHLGCLSQLKPDIEWHIRFLKVFCRCIKL